MGSRSLQVGGAAVNQAAVDVVEKAKDLAADLFEADRDDIVLDKANGRFHVVGTPALSRSWAELAERRRRTALRSSLRWISPRPVRRILRYPHLGRRSRHRDRQGECAATHRGGRRRTDYQPAPRRRPGARGIAQGVAQALLEEVVYDLDGNPLTSTLADYSFISAAELPSYETDH